MKFINVVLALLVSLGLALAILEGGLRLLGLGPDPRPLIEFDDSTGWSKRPNAVVERSSPEFHATIRTNALGLRDDPMTSPDKPEGVFRVLAVGDSFTQGFSVDREDLFVDLLERRWRAEGRAVEVVNAGTEAWDTAQQAAWLEENAAAYEPDLVLLFPYENDLYWNSQDEYFSAGGARQKPKYSGQGERLNPVLADLSDHSWVQDWAVTKWLHSPDLTGRAKHLFTPPGSARQVERELGPLLETPPAWMAQVRTHTLGALRAARAAAEAAGATALVVPIPSAVLYDDEWTAVYEEARGLAGTRWSADRPVDTFLELAAEAGLESFDPRPGLDAAAAAAGGPIYFQRTDWHFNPTGNRAFADLVHDALDAAGPAAGLPPAEVDAPTVAASTDETPAGGLPTWLVVWAALFVVATGGYYLTYPDEPKWQPPLKVGALLAVVIGMFMGILTLSAAMPPSLAPYVGPTFALIVLGVVGYYLGSKVLTILELVKSFILRGHWYLMPLLVVLLTIGSLLVVAASNPFVAPFIYTLF